MKGRLPKPLCFVFQILRDFFLRNHGLLLTGAVAYNMMLSLIPLSTVLLVVTSHFFPERMLMEILTREISLIAPGFASTLQQVLEGFLGNRRLIGGIGLLSLFFFSSMAFRVLEDAIAIIFHQPLPTLRRKFWVSALIPYFFIFIIAAGLILLSSANAIVDAQTELARTFPKLSALIQHHLGHLVYLAGVFGMVLLFTLFYKIMPVARVSFRRALAGGFTAALLWELVRHALVVYYSKVSLVNVIYGSMATIIIVLILLEAIAIVLLLGAQVIANLQRNSNLRLPWYADPEEIGKAAGENPR